MNITVMCDLHPSKNPRQGVKRSVNSRSIGTSRWKCGGTADWKTVDCCNGNLCKDGAENFGGPILFSEMRNDYGSGIYQTKLYRIRKVR